MPYVITSECVNCGVCVDSCPVSAIVEDEDGYLITSACISCGKCSLACPIEAIRGREEKQSQRA